jgi:AbrB family looped-hinge helix DNA binding protein
MSRAVVRAKGQVTLPREVRDALHVKEGDDIRFEITDDGVLMRGMTSIPLDQAWFWRAEWQQGEREASEQLARGEGTRYSDAESFLDSLT